LDLFGLISLNPSERVAFEERTAAYIADFYGGDGEDPTLDALDDLFELDGDLGTDSVGPGDGVRVLSASVTVTDQTLPLGDTFGIDCDDIDPLVAAFTLEFVYESDDPDATAGEVAARPFSTDEFRRTYIDDFLKRDDGGGGTSFFDLLCVSELRLPPGEGARRRRRQTPQPPRPFPRSRSRLRMRRASSSTTYSTLGGGPSSSAPAPRGQRRAPPAGEVDRDRRSSRSHSSTAWRRRRHRGGSSTA